ncbi:hypothetical protein VR46_40885 [Streptomyces sp. NRRL S-444]|nr:hypothetical protein VR46_40885 [Streptomyces sp. NRRL S-444]
MVVCDMYRLRSLDVAGLHALDDVAGHLHARGVAFVSVEWQPQPQRLLDIIDALYPTRKAGFEPPALLRRALP